VFYGVYGVSGVYSVYGVSGVYSVYNVHGIHSVHDVPEARFWDTLFVSSQDRRAQVKHPATLQLGKLTRSPM
jgi:hypothetical protein